MLRRVTHFCSLAILLFLSNFALAQMVNDKSDAESNHYYVGGGIGIIYIIPTVHLHFGLDNILKNTELRFGVEGTPLSLAGHLATDIIYQANFAYFGGGLRLWYIDNFSISVGALGGIRIPSGVGDFYVETGLSYFVMDGFAGSSDSFTWPAPSLKVGFSYDL